MDKVPSALSILISVSTLASIGVAIFVAWVSQKMRADMAVLKNELIAMVRNELKEYVTVQTFQEYSEVHGRDHVRMESEITRLRDFRHSTDTLLREHDAIIRDPERKKGVS